MGMGVNEKIKIKRKLTISLVQENINLEKSSCYKKHICYVCTCYIDNRNIKLVYFNLVSNQFELWNKDVRAG